MMLLGWFQMVMIFHIDRTTNGTFKRNASFKPFVNCTAQIRNGMQNSLLNLLQSMLKFSQYLQYFWDVNIKPKFSISSVVIMDFDVQHRPSSSPNDRLRIQRDKKNLVKTKNKIMETISIGDEAHTPSDDWSWNSFLANRENKANLVLYLCQKMLESNDLMAMDKRLYVSFEGDLHIVTSSATTKCPYKNNHEEADTRIFWLITLTQGNVLVRSKETDILAIAPINFSESQLDNRSIVIQYGSNDY